DRIRLNVPNIRRTQLNNLVLAYPLDLSTKKVGHNIRIPQRCNEAAPFIGNTKKDHQLKPKFNVSGLTPPRLRIQYGLTQRLGALLPLYLRQKLSKEPLSFGNVFGKLSLGSSDFSSDIQTIENLNIKKFGDLMENRGKGSFTEGMNDIAKDYSRNFLAQRGS